MGYEQMNDRDLAHAALSKDDAYGEVIRRYYSRIYLTALAMVRQPEMAEDIAQETFLRAWLRRSTVKDPNTTLLPWLVRITRNLAIDWLRVGQQRSRVLPLISMEEITVEPADYAQPDPRQAAGRAEQNRQLTDAVMRLPDDLRQAVLLHYAEGLSAGDIARMNGEARSTVTRRLDKARQLLRQHLESGLAANLAASVQPLRPGQASLQRTLGIITAATTLPAATRAQLLQLVANSPPPPLVDPVTSVATAAQFKEAGIMKSIIAKAGAGKLLAAIGAAALIVGGGAYAVNDLTNQQTDVTEYSMDKVASLRDKTNLRNAIKKANHSSFRNLSTTAVRRNTGGEELGNRPQLAERIATLKNDLVSTNPSVVPEDNSTSGGTHLNLLVVDGSGLPIEDATINLTEFHFKEVNRSGSVTVPDTTGTIRGYGNVSITPAKSNRAGIARVFVPKYTMHRYLTDSFKLRATHPDYTATFAEMELSSVTKVVMTGGHLLEVLPVDAATSLPIKAGVIPEFASSFKPEWEQRSDGTIAFRRISGEKLLFYLTYEGPNGRRYLSQFQKITLPTSDNNPETIALTPTHNVRGVLSPNVPRPVKGGKVQARVSLPNSCTAFCQQEVDVAEDGSFVLTGLPPGEIVVAGLADGFNSTRPKDDKSTSPYALAQRFRLSSNKQEYELPMEPSTNIRVQVVDEHQKPVEGAKVICTSQILINGCQLNWADDVFALSDSNGIAEITGIPASQTSWVYVTNGWQIKSQRDGLPGVLDRQREVHLVPGETLELRLIVEPGTEE